MIEGAEKILDYLPIRRSEVEDQYIDHLWDSFAQLHNGNESAGSFSVMPYHLIFMLVLQYKALRVFLQKKERYQDAFMLKSFGKKDQERAVAPESPFDLSHLRETEVVNILKIVGLSKESSQKIRGAVDYRNSIAHAAGNIESDSEARVFQHLELLKSAQEGCVVLNQELAVAWTQEIQEDENMNEFLESRFLETRVSSRDLGDILPLILESDNLRNEQWQALVDIGLEHAPSQIFASLKKMVDSPGAGDGLRSNALRILEENGERIG